MSTLRTCIGTFAWRYEKHDLPDDPDEQQEAIEALLEGGELDTPSVCAQCSGWGLKWSVDMGDDWCHMSYTVEHSDDRPDEEVEVIDYMEESRRTIATRGARIAKLEDLLRDALEQLDEGDGPIYTNIKEALA